MPTSSTWWRRHFGSSSGAEDAVDPKRLRRPRAEQQTLSTIPIRVASPKRSASPVHESYRYEPITTPNTTRMLLLNSVASGKRLSGRLEIVKLDECEPWEAVSYAWGQSKRSSHVEIDGKVLPITANLEDALLDLRCTGDECRLWVDQICVDQANPDERSIQVRLMGEIYKHAQRVLVYLGPDPGNIAKQAFFMIKMLGSLDEDQRNLIETNGIKPLDPLISHVKTLFDLPWVRYPLLIVAMLPA